MSGRTTEPDRRHACPETLEAGMSRQPGRGTHHATTATNVPAPCGFSRTAPPIEDMVYDRRDRTVRGGTRRGEGQYARRMEFATLVDRVERPRRRQSWEASRASHPHGRGPIGELALADGQPQHQGSDPHADHGCSKSVDGPRTSSPRSRGPKVAVDLTLAASIAPACERGAPYELPHASGVTAAAAGMQHGR